MKKQLYLAIVSSLAAQVFLTGCTEDNPTPPDNASGRVVFAEKFETNLDGWLSQYLLTPYDVYPPMRLSSDAAHGGSKSLTSDSNRTALIATLDPRIEDSVAVIEFFLRAGAAGQSNFSVQFGQDAGSTGGIGKGFGFGFDKSDSIRTMFYDNTQETMEQGILLSPIQIGHWYKCVVEVDFSTTTITWKLDGTIVDSKPFPVQEFYGIDKVLVFRGMEGLEGPLSYYVDDITVNKK